MKALVDQIDTWDRENKSIKLNVIQREVKKIIADAEKLRLQTLPVMTGSAEGSPLVASGMKPNIEPIEPRFDQEAFERLLLTGAEGIRIADVKAYLALGESKTHDLHWKIANEIRSRTYKQSRRKPDFEEIFRLGLSEQIEMVKRHKAENERIDEEEETWAAALVPPRLLLEIQKEKLHQQQEREIKEQRGLPPRVLGQTLPPRTVSEQREHELSIRKSLPTISADTTCSGGIIAQVLAKGQLTAAMSLLCNEVNRILVLMDPLWREIKEQGRKAIVDMVAKKTNDIGDIKGAIGELNAILFALKGGGKSVATGGKDKKLPLEPGHKLGGIDTQDIDVRYLEGKRRVYMEAKYDARTLIEKYKGSYTPKKKADVEADKGPSYQERYAQWMEEHWEAAGLAKPQAVTKKPAAEKKKPEHPVVDLALGIAPQQARYQAMRGKPASAKTESRGLSAAIANTHDWLLLFLPNSNGSLVSTRLSEAGWTIVIGDFPLDPPKIKLLLEKVEDVTSHFSKDKAEEWAETSSRKLKPADLLAGRRWEATSLYMKIQRDLLGYEGLVRGMPEGNCKKAAMEHYRFGRLFFATVDAANVEEAHDTLSLAIRELRAAQDKVYEERIERDRAARYGSASYGN